MTVRVLVLAVTLIAGLLGNGWAVAAGRHSDPIAAYTDYFTSAAQGAGSGAMNVEIRQRRVAAALSPLVIQSIVRQPMHIDAIMGALAAAAPDVAPGIARQAMASFPVFADQIGHAAGLVRFRTAGVRTSAVPASRRTLRVDPIANRANGQAARVAGWAISAIASNPAAIEEIIGRALAAAPGGEVAVVTAVQAAFPGFAGRIAAAAAAGPRAAPAPPVAAAPRRQAAMTGGSTVPATERPAKPAPIVLRQPTVMREPAAGPPKDAQLAGAAPVDQTRLIRADEESDEINDPLEPMNRIIFAFNDTVDLILLRPIAIGYNWIMPDPVIHAVRRFFLNLDGPVITANDLLQGDFADAGVTLGRFGINSTIGVLGFFDMAAEIGLERHHADFGQTLHSYDVGAGPYLVLPLIGPASTGAGAGKVVDIFFQPLTYLLSSTQNLGVAATRAVVKREELLEPLDELRESSVDYYTGLKAAYWQARQVELNKGALTGLGDGGADKLFDAAN